MISSHSRAVLFLAVLLAALWAGPVRAAFAEDDRPALERLTEKERTFLETKVKGWSDLTPEDQERRAKGILRLRSLSDVERARLLDRISELEERRERGGRRPRGRHDGRQRFEAHGRFLRAVQTALWPELSEETRAAIERVLEKRGRHDVSAAFVRSVWKQLAEAKVEAGEYAVEIPEDVPKAHRQRLEKAQAKAAQGDEKAQRMLANLAVGDEFRNLIRKLERDGPIEEVVYLRVGRKFAKRHPAVYAGTKAALEKAAEDDETLKRWARPMGHFGPAFGGGSPHEMRARMDTVRKLLKALEEAEPQLRRSPWRRQAEELREGLRRMLEGGRGRHGEGARGRGRGPGQRPDGRPGGRPDGRPDGRPGPGPDGHSGPPPSGEPGEQPGPEPEPAPERAPEDEPGDR